MTSLCACFYATYTTPFANGQEVTVQAGTAFRFADFGLSIPRVASVLSIEDNIRLEADLLLRRSS